MIKILAGVAAASTFTLMGCDQGVPQVDDPHHVVVNGQKMGQQDFLDKYCVGKIADKTCMKVTNAMNEEFAKKGHLPHKPN